MKIMRKEISFLLEELTNLSIKISCLGIFSRGPLVVAYHLHGREHPLVVEIRKNPTQAFLVHVLLDSITKNPIIFTLIRS